MQEGQTMGKGAGVGRGSDAGGDGDVSRIESGQPTQLSRLRASEKQFQVPSVLGIQVRTMQCSDIAAGRRLQYAAGWNQTHSDWKRFLAMEPQGSFVACKAGRVIGTVTTCSFGKVGWIGMMLVDPAQRRQGIATHLMQRAVERLEQVGCQCIRLDATQAGAEVYQRIGFRDCQEITRFGGRWRSVPLLRSDLRVRPLRWSDWPAVVELDEMVAGADRTKLIKRLILERPASARVVSWQGRLLGFACARPGRSAHSVGPVIAQTEEAGRALWADALHRVGRGRVIADIPKDNRPAVTAAEEFGLTALRHFLRMERGSRSVAPSIYLWASSGPEKG